MTSDGKGPIDHLLDAVLFVPAGFLANARELVPDLAAKGREQVELQVRIARMLGQFAVQMGRKEVGKRLAPLRPGGHPAPSSPRPAAAPARATVAPSSAEAPDSYDEVIPVRVVDEGPAVPATDLAIPEYDSLAASQVVPRLDGLTTEELDAVRRYEAAHRGRRTVLGKIAQLQSEA